jgi:hypothetical protein
MYTFMHSFIIPFQSTSMKTLIRTRRRDVTAERGVRFHPTIGSVTPNGFTTGHPELGHDALRFNLFFQLNKS